MGYTFEITVADHEFVRDTIAHEERGILAVDVDDVVAVDDHLAWSPGAVVIDEIDPPRARYPDNITIRGSGFSPNSGGNGVRIGGSFASIVSESETEIVAQVPFIFSIINNYLAEVEVERVNDFATGYAWMWVKPSASTLAALRINEQEPSSEEPGEEEPDTAEARDFERLVTLIEFLLRDNVPEAGDVMARDDTGLVGVTADDYGRDAEAGQVLLVDPSEAAGLVWSWQADLVLRFGGSIAANPGAAVKMVANGHQGSTVSGTNTRHYVPTTCRPDLLWLLFKTAGATDTIDRIRLLQNGSTVLYDSGTGLALGNNAVHRIALDVEVTRERYLEIEVTKLGTTDAFTCVGGVRLRL